MIKLILPARQSSAEKNQVKNQDFLSIYLKPSEAQNPGAIFRFKAKIRLPETRSQP